MTAARIWPLVLAVLATIPAAWSQDPAATPAPQDAKPADAQKKEKDETRLKVYDEIQVTDRASDMLGVADSASEGVTGHADLERRPIARPGELLETVPGVIITQHSGSGKANQYFLRGFNLDHGTDFRITVDDIPVNMPSHGYGRLLAADSKRVGDGDLLGALEVGRNNGPWVRPDDYRKLNGVLRWNRGDAANGLTVTAMGYDGHWNSTDQIPERAVTEGLISRFGEIDPTDGGRSSRYSLAADWRQGRADSLTRASVYALRYGLDLFSNFTYFLDDPVNGDQFHQSDHRTVAGFQVEHQWAASWLGREVQTSPWACRRGGTTSTTAFSAPKTACASPPPARTTSAS
ncbi:MAG: TonB-dependent receptor plug domain-containing protein [Acidobacteria bacterium]|nr:TonB-dependent receptor plug domain-containing protein [Acidobacteriota bacterium]